jgi:hypothetical protein
MRQKLQLKRKGDVEIQPQVVSEEVNIAPQLPVTADDPTASIIHPKPMG